VVLAPNFGGRGSAWSTLLEYYVINLLANGFLTLLNLSVLLIVTYTGAAYLSCGIQLTVFGLVKARVFSYGEH